MKAKFDILKQLRAEFGPGFENSILGRVKILAATKLSSTASITIVGEGELIAETSFRATESELVIEGASTISAYTTLESDGSSIIINAEGEFDATSSLRAITIIDGFSKLSSETKLQAEAGAYRTFFLQGEFPAQEEV